MNRLAFVIVFVVAFALSAGAQTVTGNGTTSSPDTRGVKAAPEGNSMETGDEMTEDPNHAALEKSGGLADPKMGNQLRMARGTGRKIIFKDLVSAEALAVKNPTVLFFAADWCPSCQADLKDINTNGARLGKVNVVVVDYDKSASLKAKYGVTVQDTFVQIDAKGTKLAIWNGGGVDGVLAHLKESM